MNPLGLFFALTAPILYGIGNATMAHKLTGVSNLAMMIVFNATILAAAIAMRRGGNGRRRRVPP